MKRNLVIMTLLAVMLFTGCGQKDSDESRVLSMPDEASIREVKDFSAFLETELPTEAPETEAPETEPPQTEPLQTEAPETEPPEIPYSEDYDFSDETVLAAAFSGSDYQTDIILDYQNRIRTMTASKDGLTVSLTADTKSGTSSYRCEFSGDSDKVRQAVLLLRDGVDEDNLERFFEGAYNGEDNAPLIGLKNVSCTAEGQMVTAVLEKKQAELEGKVPGWQDEGIDIGTVLGSVKLTGALSDGADFFGDILSGISFSKTKMESFTLQKTESKTADGKTSLYADFAAVYTSEDGSRYEISMDGTNSDTQGLSILVRRADLQDSAVIMAVADHIYQGVYEGELDTSADLTQPYQKEHCSVAKTEDGFQMFLF